jgi:hypothetical protein
MFDPERVDDAKARFRRFERLVKLQIQLWDLVNVLLDEENVRLRGGAERDVSWIS